MRALTCCSLLFLAECVPAAARVEQLKKFMWITTWHLLAVLENRNLQYLPAQPNGRQFGLLSTDFHRQFTARTSSQGAQGPQGRDHPRGRAYGVDVRKGNEGAQEAGFDIVPEGELFDDRARSVLSGHQMKRARPDVIFTRYKSRHHAVPAPGQGAGPAFQRAGRHGPGYGIMTS